MFEGLKEGYQLSLYDAERQQSLQVIAVEIPLWRATQKGIFFYPTFFFIHYDPYSELTHF